MKAQVVSFHCVLKTKLGKLISSTFNHEVLTYPGAASSMLQGLAEGLQDLKKGERRLIHLTAEQAYGFYDPNKVIECDRERLAKMLRQGQEVVLPGMEGQNISWRVISVDSDTVTLDGNHPLAGQDLVFEIEATYAREATAEELEDDPAPVGRVLH